jgi:hypothetical protein
LPKKSFYAVHAEPKLFFEPMDFSALIADPEIIGLHISPKGRGNTEPVAGSLYAWAAERFGTASGEQRLFPSPPVGEGGSHRQMRDG